MSVTTTLTYEEARLVLKNRWINRKTDAKECPKCGSAAHDWEVGGYNMTRLYLRCEDCDNMETIRFEEE